MTKLSAEMRHALDQARVLAKLGVPVFVAYPNDSELGYRLPNNWPKFKANPRYVNAWRPGCALVAVTGHSFDVLDVDPRNGWPADVDEDLEWFLRFAPFAYATVDTPSGGFHAYVKGLGIGKCTPRPGIDILAGAPDGTGRSPAFLPPTVRASKVTGELRPYRWTSTIDENDLAGYGADRTGALLAEAMSRPVRVSSTRSASGGRPGTSLLRELPAALVKSRLANGRHNGVVSLAGMLRNRGVNYEEALNLMRRDVWDKIDQSGDSYPMEEFEADFDDVFERYPEGDAPPIVPDPSDPFLGAGDGLTDAQLSAEVARVRLDGHYHWARGLEWLQWTGKQWLQVDEETVIEVVRRFLLVQRQAAMESTQNRGNAETAWRAVLHRNRIVAITALARGIAGINIDAADFDQEPDLLNCLNGVVDLRTGKLLPHDPARLMTKCTGANYQSGVRHADWDAALEAIPEDVRDWVQLRYGQGVTGYRSPDDMMLLQDGDGENGKSTLGLGARGALGDYFTQVSRGALRVTANIATSEKMAFRGARFALLEELPEEHRLNATALKDAVGQPFMKARFLHKNEVEFRSTHSLFLNTNTLPIVNETDHGTWRRLARLRFPFKFLRPGIPTGPNEKVGDPNLRDRVEKGEAGQWEAALAWLVAGAVRWYEADRIMPPHPPRVEANITEWRGKSDLILAYAHERLIVEPGRHVMSTELLDDFNGWLQERNQETWSDRLLTTRLEQHSTIKPTKSRVRLNDRLSRREDYVATSTPGQYSAWHGLRFRTADDEL